MDLGHKCPVIDVLAPSYCDSLFFLASWISLGRRLFHIKRRDLSTMMLMGSMIALSQLCYVAAISSAGVSVSTLIAICAAPVLIVLLSALIVRERLTPMTLIALVAALSGTVLLVATRSPSGGGNVSLFGALLAFLSACGYAELVFCGRLLTSSYHPLQISSVSFGTGALLFLVCALSTRLVLGYRAGGWLMLLYWGVFPRPLAMGSFR